MKAGSKPHSRQVSGASTGGREGDDDGSGSRVPLPEPVHCSAAPRARAAGTQHVADGGAGAVTAGEIGRFAGFLGPVGAAQAGQHAAAAVLEAEELGPALDRDAELREVIDQHVVAGPQTENGKNPATPSGPALATPEEVNPAA